MIFIKLRQKLMNLRLLAQTFIQIFIKIQEITLIKNMIHQAEILIHIFKPLVILIQSIFLKIKNKK